MDFLNAVGVHNDTIMVVELRNLKVHRAAKSSMDWTAGGAQFHSPALPPRLPQRLVPHRRQG
eukprot:1778876-Pleurochrysis_carterae.AAC.1